jgi:hypothetical protein
MSKTMYQWIWVAVRVQGGFITEVRAYRNEDSARRCERSWRRKMNPEYDETAVSAVRLKSSESPRSSESGLPD